MPTIEDFLQGDVLKKAQLQDVVARIIFNTVSDAVLHGGTCVWRCYGGKRFSKDIDIYIAKDSTIKKVLNKLAQSGLTVEKDAQRRSTRLYTVKGSTEISFQIRKKHVESEVVPYFLVDGTMMDVYAISPEAAILEKISAYSDRGLERDLYDIKVLISSVIDKSIVKGELMEFIMSIKKPKDRGALKGLVYEGIIPDFEEMVRYIERWCEA